MRIILMSVKDKIAMWNSMANNSQTPLNNNNKLVASEPAPKPKQIEKEKKIVLNQPIHSSDEPKASPTVGETLNLKKTDSTQQSEFQTEQTVKAPTLPQKPNEIVRSTETAHEEKKEVVKDKFNDIKKQLQQLTAGKGIYFAPQPPKKVDVVMNNSGGVEYQIQKQVPKCSVKQQAVKLAQFYLQKRLHEVKRQQEKHRENQEEKMRIQQENHQKESENIENVYRTKQQPNKCLNITLDQNLPHHTTYPNNQKGELKNEEDGEGLDMHLRTVKNKKKREQFGSDEDLLTVCIFVSLLQK